MGCGSSTDVDTPRASQSPRSPDFQNAQIADGERAYQTYCVGCHGDSGDGKGPSAGFMHPRPRNFQKALFRFSSTRGGQLPTDTDLRRSIEEGLKGSAMPAWNFLPDHTIDTLVVYIKTFSPKWEKHSPALPIPFVSDPYRAAADKSEAIARGEVIYHGYATCWTCHPAYVSHGRINDHLEAMDNPRRDAFRPGLSESEIKVNSENQITYPPDFLRDFMRAGVKVDDLYRSIGAGITGTAMPTWVDSMAFDKADGTPLTRVQDLWALAYYVRSLIQQRPAKLAPGAFTLRDRRQGIYLNGEVPPPVQLPITSGTDESFEEQEFLDEDE